MRLLPVLAYELAKGDGVSHLPSNGGAVDTGISGRVVAQCGEAAWLQLLEEAARIATLRPGSERPGHVAADGGGQHRLGEDAEVLGAAPAEGVASREQRHDSSEERLG